jgi:alpha/beta superfamily hydrolase
LLGFSFGGFVAASLGGRLEAQGERSSICSWSRRGDAPGRSDQLPQNGPLTLIQPETDEVIDPQLVYDWSDNLNAPMSC